MDLIKTQLIGSVVAGVGEMGTSMRGLEWSATVFGSLDQWPQTAFYRNVNREFRTTNALVLGALGDLQPPVREPEGETER